MNPLQQRLISLRRRLRSVTWARGLSLVVVALLGAALVAGWLDWELHLPAAVRALLLVAALAGAVAVGYRFLFAPLHARADDLALALRVEKEYPVLNDALASTVQFLQQPDDSTEAGSPALRKEAIQRALRLAQGCDFGRVVNARGLWLSGLASFCIVVLVAVLFLWHPGIVRSAALRLVHPFGEHDWETQTRLVLHYPKRVEAGRKFQIRGEVFGVIPKNAVVRLKNYTLGDNPPREYPISVNKDGKAEFLAKLDLSDQRENFQFTVEANDARSPHRIGRWHTVQVAQPPRLVPVDGVPSPQTVLLDLPAYTDLPTPRALAPGTKHIDAIEGTWITMEARADTPLKQAWIVFEPNGEEQVAKFTALDAAKLGPIGLAHPLAALSTHALTEAAWAPVPVQLDASRTKLFMHFRPWLTGAHILHIEDDTGLTNEYTFDVQLLHDPAPVVALDQPASNRTLLPKAEVHLEITAQDEKFGLKSVFLEYWRKDKHGSIVDHKIERLPLVDADPAVKGLAESVLDPFGNPFSQPEPPALLKPLYLKVKKRWSLEGLVKEGDVLVIRAGAADFNDVPAYNTPGYSHEVELTIVGKTEMNISLDQAQAKLQDKIARLKELQKGALDNIKEVDGKWDAKKPLNEGDLKKLLDKIQDAGQWQKEMQDLIGKEKNDGLLHELNQLEGIIKDNKIDSSDAKDRVKLLLSELKKIDKKLELIPPQINKLKDQIGDTDPDKKQKDTKKDLADTKAQQAQVLQALEDLLKHLDRWAQLHQLRAETQALLHEQKKVLAETEKLDEAAVKDKSWTAKIGQVADQQFQLATDAQRLLHKLEKAKEKEADKNPDIAKLYDDALQIASENQLIGAMKDADEKIRDTQLKIAQQKDQVGIIEALKDMIDALTEKRDDQLDKLIKQQGKAKSELHDFIEKLEKLQKQVDEAKKIADPEQQKQALQKLAAEQQKLQDEAQKKAMELARLRADEAAQQMTKAAKQMEQALKKLEAGGDPLEEQQHALEEMKQAEKKLQQAQKETEEELAREKLAKIADQIQALKERQDEATAETGRLHKMVMQEGWKGEWQGAFQNHGAAQLTLAREAASLAQKLKGAKVFELILTKAGGNMTDATTKIRERLQKSIPRRDNFPFSPEDLKDENQSNLAILKAQKQAGQRLQSLLDAVKEAQKQQLAKAQEPEQKPDQKPDQPKGGLKATDGIPPLAQLQALTAEQQLVNDRTKAFAKEHPNMDNLPPEAQAELKLIHADQEALFELFQEITAAVNQGEKK